MGVLTLQFSVDGMNWYDLQAIASGDQGDVWHSKTIDLTLLGNTQVFLRFFAQLFFFI